MATKSKRKAGQPVVITGRMAVAVSTHSGFDLSNPGKTDLDSFSFIRSTSVTKGVLDGWWAKEGFRLVGFAEIKVELLPVNDMLTSAVATLKAQKTEIIATAQAEATRIEGEIQKLLAITFEG